MYRVDSVSHRPASRLPLLVSLYVCGGLEAMGGYPCDVEAQHIPILAIALIILTDV